MITTAPTMYTMLFISFPFGQTRDQIAHGKLTSGDSLRIETDDTLVAEDTRCANAPYAPV